MARKKKLPRKSKIVAKALIAFGILLFLLGTFTHAHLYYRFIVTQKEKPIKSVSQTPSKLSIPSHKLDLNIVQGGIVSGEWVLSNTNALYLPTSGKIGEGYNTIIYAHNTKQLFGDLEKLAIGDIILITDNQGKEFEYTVFSREEVKPTDLKKLYSDEKNIVTLFTCDGWLDSQRLVVKARLSSN